MIEFRTLRADEIDCRVQQVTEKGCIVLLYKDARSDMNILDETVGCMNWQRSHGRDNANCVVSIWDEDKKQWVSKEDTGTESNTEAEKGLASDSFKRACVNWGIGRELYTSPFIWIKAQDCKITQGRNGKPTTYDKFSVASIAYDDRRNICELSIRNDSTKAICFEWYANKPKPRKAAPKEPAHDPYITRSMLAEILDTMMRGNTADIASAVAFWTGDNSKCAVADVPDEQLADVLDKAMKHYRKKSGQDFRFTRSV